MPLWLFPALRWIGITITDITASASLFGVPFVSFLIASVAILFTFFEFKLFHWSLFVDPDESFILLENNCFSFYYLGGSKVYRVWFIFRAFRNCWSRRIIHDKITSKNLSSVIFLLLSTIRVSFSSLYFLR